MRHPLLFLSCFLLISVSGISADPGLYPPPGTYSCPLNVEITDTGGGNILFWFEESADKTAVPYSCPLELSALPGEERSYTLYIEEDGNGPYSYIIDRKPPDIPKASVDSGIYHDDVFITFSISGSGKLYYSMNEGPHGRYEQWRGEPISLGIPGSGIAEYYVKAYSVDAAGNRSRTAEYKYILQSDPGKKEQFLTVRSPLVGNYANPQLLYIEHFGYDWIRYSVNGKNPISGGKEYTGPVVIGTSGRNELRIAGKPAGSQVPVQHEVVFTVIPETGGDYGFTAAESGIYPGPLRIDPPRQEGYRYTLNDEPAEPWDYRFEQTIVLESSEKVRKVYALRCRDFAAADSIEYRYMFILDDRVPAQPEIAVFPSREDGTIDVVLLGPPGDEIYYTLDGKAPGRDGVRYTGPFTLVREEGEIDFSLQAVTVSGRGRLSPPAEYTRRFSFSRPPRPAVSRLEDTNGFLLTRETDGEDAVRYVFTVSEDPSKPPDDPGSTSPMCSDRFIYPVPYGMEKMLYVKFAGVSSEGAVSAATDVYSLHIDRNPPEEPRIEYSGGILRIKGNDSVYYTLTEEKPSYSPPEPISAEYTGPIELPGVKGERTQYTVSAAAVDESGNSSGTAGPVKIIVDTRTAETPPLKGAEDGAAYSSEELVLRWEPYYPDTRILYTVGTYDKPSGYPDETSPAAENNRLVLQGRPGQSVTYTVRYRAYIPGSGSLGKTADISCTIDLEPPGPPEPVGIVNNAVLPAGPRIDLAEREVGVEYSVGIGTVEDPPKNCFGPESRSLETPFILDAGPGNEETFTLLFGCRDEGGNLVYNDTLYTITVDRKAPAVPRPFGTKVVFSSSPVTVESPGPGTALLYSQDTAFRNGGSTAPGEFIPLDEPLVFEGREGEEIEYLLRFKARDEAGNVSGESGVYRIVVDRVPPDIAALGYSFVETEDGTCRFERYEKDVNELYYAVGENRDFTKYTGPFEIPDGKDKDSRTLSVYLRDKAGNTSETARFKIAKPLARLDAPAIAGVRDGQVTGSTVTLSGRASYGIIRYELTEGPRGGPVSRFSPQLETPLSVDVLPGEEKTYTLAARTFSGPQTADGGAVKVLSFTIDRSPPDPPAVDGVEPDNYYQNSVEVGLSAPEGTIFYSVGSVQSDNEETFTTYTGPFKVDASEDKPASYLIRAYTVDSAGNRSIEERRLRFHFDSAVVYVSRSRGNDLYDGSREKPLKTITKALEAAKNTGRRTVFLSEGLYEIDRTIILESGVNLFGGFSKEDWSSATTSVTAIVPGTYFPEDSSLIETSSENTFIENISFMFPRSGSGKMLTINGGSVTVSKCSFITEQDWHGIPILVENGRLRAAQLRIDLASSGGKYGILLSRGSEGNIIDARLESSGKGRKDTALVRVEDKSFLTATRSSFFPGAGRETAGIRIDNGFADFEDVEISAGSGGSVSHGIHAVRSEVRIHNSLITGRPDSAVTFGIKSIDTDITMKGTMIRTGGTNGSTAVYARDGIFSADGITVEQASSPGFLGFIKLESAKGNIFNSVFKADCETYFTGIDLNDSQIDFFNNTCIFGVRTDGSAGIRIEGDYGSRIINNIIANPLDSPAGTPVRIIQRELPISLEFRTNCLSGWENGGSSGGVIYSDAEGLNSADGDPLSGRIHRNFSEEFRNLFKVSKENGYEPLQSSPCTDAGIDLSGSGGPVFDRAGRIRPNPDSGIRPAWDIGAYEYY